MSMERQYSRAIEQQNWRSLLMMASSEMGKSGLGVSDLIDALGAASIGYERMGQVQLATAFLRASQGDRSPSVLSTIESAGELGRNAVKHLK